MILRRLAEAMAEQNWFIILIEVLVVVVGIFIGLQVDDWNESRKDRQDEQLSGLDTKTSYFDPVQGEVRSRPQCDVVKMHANPTFLNEVSVNIDRYDAYIRDGLAPWSAQFDRVHQLVDGALSIDHGAGAIR